MSARNMIIMAPAQAAQVLVGIGSVVVFTRMMPAEEFGLYALILSASMLAHTLLLSWAEAGAFRFLPQAEREGQSAAHFATLNTLAAAVMGACLCGCVIGVLASPVWGWTAAAIGFAALWSGLRFVTKIARETDRVEHRMARYAWRETALVAGGFVIAVVMLQLTPMGPAAPFFGAALAGVAIAALDWPVLRARANGASHEPARTHRFFLYGAPLAVGLGVDLAMQTATRALLTSLEGAAAAGAYAAASGAVGRALDVLFLWTALAFAPALLRAHERGERDGMDQASAALVRGIFAVSAPACIGVCLVATPLCTLLVGPALATQAAALAPAVAAASFFTGLNVYLATEAFVLSRRTGLRAGLLIIAGLAHLVLLYVCIGAFGVLGAGYASAASAALAFVLLMAVGARLIVWRIPFMDLAKIAVGCLAMTLAVMSLPASGGVLELASKASLGASIYAVCLIALDMGGLRAWFLTRWRKAPA